VLHSYSSACGVSRSLPLVSRPHGYQLQELSDWQYHTAEHSGWACMAVVLKQKGLGLGQELQ
jgi:hypothetical protein